MASGLFALLDDVAAIARVAATTVDDVAGMAAKAGTKSMGVVVDDAAVTPTYVTGFKPARELPIIWKIAKGSLRNKLLYLLPAALVLSLVAPWAIPVLLIFGGLFLCFEGAEKVLEMVSPHAHAEDTAESAGTPEEMEAARTAGAIKTDFILSAEIMAITLAAIPDGPFWERALVLALVGVFITLLVYGVVALIVKMDDIGLAIASKPGASGAQVALGKGIVHAMPWVLKTLSLVGTAAMLWVGGGILLHQLEILGFAAPAHLAHDIAAVGAGVPGLQWLITAALSAAIGIAVGFALVPVVTKGIVPLAARLRGKA